MVKHVILLVLFLSAAQLLAQSNRDVASYNDLASLAVVNEVDLDVSNKEGVVTIRYSSAIPENIELQFLTKSGSILWHKMLYSFSGKVTEKLEFLVPEGNYITRVYHGNEEITTRITFK